MTTVESQVQRIDFPACLGWLMDDWCLRHETGRYFSVIAGHDGHQEHILIDQPEVGILGILYFGDGSERRWLLQHKPEPGNVPYAQWAPSVQATVSNYQRIHGGKPTPFLDWFATTESIPYDVLGSEQGDRFLNKFNRNVKRSVPPDVADQQLPSNYAWFSSAEVRVKLREDLSMNTDARSVLASGAWDLLADSSGQIFLNGTLPAELAEAFHRSAQAPSPHRIAAAQELLRRVHHDNEVPFRRIPLSALSSHQISDSGIHTSAGKPVLGFFDCALPYREVPRWQQPLLERDTPAEHALLFRRERGVAWFLVTAWPEPGFPGRTEFGPSIQSGDTPGKQTPEAIRATLEQSDITVISAIRQTDEGGRFYRNEGRFVLAECSGAPELAGGSWGAWLTLGDLECFSRQQSHLTNELRTLLSLVLAFA